MYLSNEAPHLEEVVQNRVVLQEWRHQSLRDAGRRREPQLRRRRLRQPLVLGVNTPQPKPRQTQVLGDSVQDVHVLARKRPGVVIRVFDDRKHADEVRRGENGRRVDLVRDQVQGPVFAEGEVGRQLVGGVGCAEGVVGGGQQEGGGLQPAL
jgi:hypothetical protein